MDMESVAARLKVGQPKCSGMGTANQAPLPTSEKSDLPIMAATAVPMTVSDALLAAADSDEARAFDMINVWSHSGLTHLPGAPGPGFSVFVSNRRLMERQRPGVLAADFRACNAYADGLSRAAGCTVPVLLILGGADQMTPVKATRALVAALPSSETVVIAGAGHALMTERPDQVLSAIRNWLAVRSVATA